VSDAKINLQRETGSRAPALIAAVLVRGRCR
jgi:hypothetical protein